MITPDVIDQISGAIVMDTTQVSKGLGATAPTVLGSLSQQTRSPDGAAALTSSLAKLSGSNSPLGGLERAIGGSGDLLGGLLGAARSDTSNTMVTSLLGEGANAIGGSLSKSLGFDVRPILTIAVPAVAGIVNKFVKEGGLDASGVAKLLQGEADAYMSNPANAETSRLVKQALADGNQAATLRGAFTDAEWAKVKGAPLAALYLVSSASPSRWGGTSKELSAAARVVAETAQGAPVASLLSNSFAAGIDMNAFEQMQRESPSQEAVLNHIREAAALVTQKSPSEVPAFRATIIRTAEQAATAAKEGGFFGMGGTLVTVDEQAAISAITDALS
ncbi:MAG: DUF937 domain-containing protein [Chloroflexales bacterium]|nr:DUF937 domain-containing protein [Chloroflexales bacterium]